MVDVGADDAVLNAAFAAGADSVPVAVGGAVTCEVGFAVFSCGARVSGRVDEDIPVDDVRVRAAVRALFRNGSRAVLAPIDERGTGVRAACVRGRIGARARSEKHGAVRVRGRVLLPRDVLTRLDTRDITGEVWRGNGLRPGRWTLADNWWTKSVCGHQICRDRNHTDGTNNRKKDARLSVLHALTPLLGCELV